MLMTNQAALLVSNQAALLTLMGVLIAIVVLLTVLGIVFIIALRKRAPVIKVVMASPMPKADEPDEEPAPAPEAPEPEQLVMEGIEPADEPKPVEAPKPKPEPEPEPEDDGSDGDDEDDVSYVTEGKARVHYDRSFTAKIIQLSDEGKEWYTQVKNELLSYQKIKARTSWKKEAFRLGRNTIARFVVRGKTLCLLLAVEPEGFAGTKFSVEDVSSTASLADTPCLYRIKSARRAKYAKEMINAVMKELAIRKDPNFMAQDYYVAYEGTMGLMEKGLIKRVVTNSSRTFEVREISEEERLAAQAAAASADEAATTAENAEDKSDAE